MAYKEMAGKTLLPWAYKFTESYYVSLRKSLMHIANFDTYKHLLAWHKKESRQPCGYKKEKGTRETEERCIRL